MLEYVPELFRVIDQNFGSIITHNEQHILNEIRALSNNSDPSISNVADRQAIEEFVAKITHKHG
jgi:short-subunit dehydrogenase involved in D-alanine esterification of teichoic acids